MAFTVVYDNLATHRPDIPPAALMRTRALMCDAVPDCLIAAADLVHVRVSLPDRDDHHVLAAAVSSGAHAIVTFNLRDFPPAALAPLGVEARHPDDFVLDAIDLRPAVMLAIIEQQAAALRNPPMTSDTLLEILGDRGLPRSVASLHALRGSR